MAKGYVFTRHANERSTARGIPTLIAEFIMEFGQSCDAGNGAQKYWLTKDSLTKFRRIAGRAMSSHLSHYRNHNAYVIAARGSIITVAYAASNPKN